MTKKLSFSLRWTIVFTVLVLFSFYSLTTYSLIKGDSKVYAESISKDKELSGGNRFVAIEDDESEDNESEGQANSNNRDNSGRDKDDWKDRYGSKRFKKVRRICVLNQGQLNSLQSSFTVNIQSITLESGRIVSIAVVDKSEANKKQIYAAIGVDKKGKTCKIIQQNRAFFLFLAPGVS